MPGRWLIRQGEGPLFAAANHSGHELRPEVAKLIALEESARLREEDPYTDQWVTIVPNSIIPFPSRFEVDLNRSLEEAFYLQPEDAWGLKIWKKTPSQEMMERSYEFYQNYYFEVRKNLEKLERRYRRFVVLDLHSYNYRRAGPKAPPEDPQKNPEINLGTGTMNRERWAPLIDRFLADLRSFDFLGRRLDVRENVKFYGRQFPKWIHENFPDSGCVLAIEVKKFFMDEWTGEPDRAQLETLGRALQSTLPGILEELGKL